MDENSRAPKKVITCLLLTIGLRSIFYGVMISTRTVRGIGGFRMLSPGIAAVVTRRIFADNLRELGWRGFNWRFLLVGIHFPFFYALALCAVLWIACLGGVLLFGPMRLLVCATIGLLLARSRKLGLAIGLGQLFHHDISDPDLVRVAPPVTWLGVFAS